MSEGIVAMTSLFVVIPIVVATVLYYRRKFSHMERMKAIESGAKMSDLVIDNKSDVGKYSTIRFGMLLIGGGLGLLIGLLLQENTRMPEPGGVFSMLFLFAGIGLLAAYFIENKQEKSNRE